MNTLLWIAQGVGAALFLGYGLRKLVTPQDVLKQRISWVTEASRGFVLAIGWLEIAGALGLILPSVTRILPVLTPIAAVALSVLMVLGAALHLRRHEYREVLTQEPWLFAMFVFVAWGRFGAYSL
jgi:uncharacterized membrane protein